MEKYSERLETHEGDYARVTRILDCTELTIGYEDALCEDGFTVTLTDEEVMKLV